MANIVLSLAVSLPLVLSSLLANIVVPDPAGPQCYVPVTNPDSYDLQEGETLDIPVEEGVLKNDSDLDGRALTAIKLTDPENGILTWNIIDDGSFSYTPNAGYSGEDSFTYKAYNGVYYSPAVTVTLTTLPMPRVFLPLIMR